MKPWILSFCYLICAKAVLACGGWYPFGEDIRFSLFSPSLFDDGGMNDFYYSADAFSETYAPVYTSDRNVDDWYKLCESKVSKEFVYEAVYRLSSKEIVDPKSKHPFVQKMLELGRRDQLEYLAFAKKYSYLNAQTSDPWEKGDSRIRMKRKKALAEAKKLAEQAVDPSLKRRYAFVAIRFAFYNADQVEVSRLYRAHFNGKEELTIDYWAKYYALQGMESGAERNFKVAQLFERIPTKRRGLHVLFDQEIECEDVLRLAKTNEEKANVLFMYALRKTDRQLASIQAIYALNPKHSLLSFLIVREANKLEDWVLSPTFTAFAPVMRPDGVYDPTQELIHAGVLEDREYARKMLSWVNSAKSNLDPELVSSVSVLLQFMNENPEVAYQTLNKANYTTEDRKNWKTRMMGMLKVATSASADLQSMDLSPYLTGEYTERERFLFVIGRLYEFKGNLSAAAILYSQLNMEESYENMFVWADPIGLTKYNISFYMNYFDYFDANYTAQDLVNITDYARNAVREFPKLQAVVSRINHDKFRLLDLIGTKYLREADLRKSLSFLEQVPLTYWESDTNNYKVYLAANPFYADFYSAHSPTAADTLVYTKYEVVKKLNDLIELEKTQTGNAKAKTNFLIANCYFNMTTHGNSWMMRRSWWSTYSYHTVFVDSDEFNKCVLARAHYMKAAEVTQSDGFEALCLRMAGRCESYALYFEDEYDYDFDYDKMGGYREYMFNKNTTYKLLKQKYPDWHDELVSNCYSFNRFYRMI